MLPTRRGCSWCGGRLCGKALEMARGALTVGVTGLHDGRVGSPDNRSRGKGHRIAVYSACDGARRLLGDM